MRRGFSLVEVLVVTGILAILAGLLLPVFKHARRSAQRMDAAVRLRQLQVAFSQYRAEYDGEGVYGHLYTMGLPDASMVSRMAIDETPPFRPIQMFASACGIHPRLHDVYGGVEYGPSPSDEWADSARLYRDSIILVSDITCNEADILPHNPHQTKFAIGVLLSGSIVRARKSGDHGDPSWWSNPPDG